MVFSVQASTLENTFPKRTVVVKISGYRRISLVWPKFLRNGWDEDTSSGRLRTLDQLIGRNTVYAMVLDIII